MTVTLMVLNLGKHWQKKLRPNLHDEVQRSTHEAEAMLLFKTLFTVKSSCRENVKSVPQLH